LNSVEVSQWRSKFAWPSSLSQRERVGEREKVNLLFKKIMFRIMANSIAAAAAFG
jgi:hypothetical protein